MKLRRVVVTGSECTGKTTLSRALADHYDTVWVPEYARRWVEAAGTAPTAADVDPIARGQIASEDRRAAGATRLLVLDTDLLSTVVYARHYFDSVDAWIVRAAEERRADLYLLAGLDVPWVADGALRDRPHEREEIQQAFRRELARSRRPVIALSGSHETRLRDATAAIDDLLA